MHSLLLYCARAAAHQRLQFTWNQPTDAHSLFQAKADLQRSNEARDLLEQAVEEMKRELIGAAAMSSERAALQDEVALRALAAMNQISHGAPVAGCIVAWHDAATDLVVMKWYLFYFIFELITLV